VGACGALPPAQRADATAARGDIFSSLACISRTHASGEAAAVIGSGTVVDPSGLVLTAFHVVGFRHIEALRLGQAPPRFDVAFTDSAREAPSHHYRAHVVRLEASLDLALLRIDGDAQGHPVREPFHALPLGKVPMGAAAPVLAMGFPGSFTTPQMTRGTVTGFTPSAEKAVSWLRTDAQLLPGMSGGALLDADGRLIGIPLQVVEPQLLGARVSLARPIDRIPPRWISDVREGRATATPVDQYQVREGHPQTGVFVGDEASDESERVYLFTARGRPGVVRVEPPAATVSVLDAAGIPLRTSHGAVEVLADEDPLMWIEIAVRTGRAPTRWRATFEPDTRGPDPLPTAVLEVVVGPSGERAPKGHLVVGPAGIDAFEWASDWAAGRKSVAELAAAHVFAATYAGETPVRVSGLVRGGLYRVGVHPDSGKGLSAEVRIRSSAEQKETLHW
jgi:S1-C subfamily serine protease